MNKKTRLKLNETLNKALEPPRTRDKSKLDELLNLYDVQEKPRLEIISEAKVLPNHTQPNPTQPKTTQPKTTQPKQVEISPIKDFTKVPNSITKEAIPQKFFKGLSKHTYDILYRHTRGNIKPVRKIQLTKGEIMKLTGLSFNTIQTHIRYLRESGLVKVEFNIGKHEGSIYEILVPEEINYPTQLNPTQDNPTQDKTTLKTQPDTTQKLGILGLGNLTENKDTYENTKTSLKTIENNDDEPFSKMIETLAKVFEKVSGKRPQKKDAEKLNEFAELIAMELEIAAARTKSISNVPAFLTEHLRRRLIGKSAQVEGKAKASKPTKVGKQEVVVEEYKAEPLTEQGREAVLKTMQEYIGRGEQDFVMSQQDTYNEEDWSWLMQELKKEKV
jgi:DNA-binding transcriptional regulator GbsR (MarR family)